MKILQLLLTVFICLLLHENANAFFNIYLQRDTLPNPKEVMERRRAMMLKMDTSTITSEEFKDVTGRRLRPAEQRRFEKARKRNAEYLKKHPRIKFKLWGFFLGLFLGPVGVAIAYIFSKSRDFKLSTLIGFAGWGVLIIPFVFVILLITGGSVFR